MHFIRKISKIVIVEKSKNGWKCKNNKLNKWKSISIFCCFERRMWEIKAPKIVYIEYIFLNVVVCFASENFRKLILLHYQFLLDILDDEVQPACKVLVEHRANKFIFSGRRMQKLVSNRKIPAKVALTPCLRKPPQMALALLISIYLKSFCMHFIYWGQVAHYVF